MKNILVIGAGAMGSAIARGLSAAGYRTGVFNRSLRRLENLSGLSGTSLFSDLGEAFASTTPELVIIALPTGAIQAISEAVERLAPEKAVVASLSPMTSLANLRELFPGHEVMRIMPNTGITKSESMTFICCDNEKRGMETAALFRNMGDAALIPEKEMGAVTALASCGTAYALRYIRACMQAGVQMGLEPADACRYTLRTLKGACALLDGGESHPEAEIDKVCTPGGLTIKGLNTLDSEGFSRSIIKAITASYKA